jgi:hypothetical protein
MPLRVVRDPDIGAGDFGYDEELTRWLAESGRRRAVSMKNIETMTLEVSALASEAATGSPSGEPVALRRLLILCVLALSAFQYVFVDTELRITQLPALIVFAAQEK